MPCPVREDSSLSLACTMLVNCSVSCQASYVNSKLKVQRLSKTDLQVQTFYFLRRRRVAARVGGQYNKSGYTQPALSMECICQCTVVHIYQVTPRVFSWGVLQQQRLHIVTHFCGIHLSMYNCLYIYQVTPRVLIWRILQQTLYRSKAYWFSAQFRLKSFNAFATHHDRHVLNVRIVCQNDQCSHVSKLINLYVMWVDALSFQSVGSLGHFNTEKEHLSCLVQTVFCKVQTDKKAVKARSPKKQSSTNPKVWPFSSVSETACFCWMK